MAHDVLCLATRKGGLVMSLDVVLLRQSYEIVGARASQPLARLDALLAARFPEVKRFVQDGSPVLDATIRSILAELDDPERAARGCRAMGAHHAMLVRDEVYPWAAACLLASLEACGGSAFTAEMARAWSDALDFVCGEALAGASEARSLSAAAE